MELIRKIAIILTIVGALNWGLVGFFNFDLVAFILGAGSLLSRIVYMLVGVSGIIAAISATKCCLNKDK